MRRPRKAQPKQEKPGSRRLESPSEAPGAGERTGSAINTGDIAGVGIAIGDHATAHVTVVAGGREYEVAGLANPYLGLRAFGADEHDIFAGRASAVRALVARLGAAAADRLTLIVGASGSGKSSFARAGLLPELAAHFRGRGVPVTTRVIDHPGRDMAAELRQALDGFAGQGAAPGVLLLLLDQFEELFSQAGQREREQALELLADVQARPGLPVRIVATLRSDFLPALLADARFAEPERHKVVLRAMAVDELEEAIQRPIQVRHPSSRIEPELVRRLATDAAADASYLPLLQVTLEDLWRGGTLRLAAYRGLANAIKDRADTVFTYRDYNGLRQITRGGDEQREILAIFLSLVRASLSDAMGDMRRRRPRAEVSRGDPLRDALIADLASARLLRTDREVWGETTGAREVETVDLVHEALLSEWPTLRAAIDAERDMLRQRERFYLALEEWAAHERGERYLLAGVRLAEAEAFAQRGDDALEAEGAREFLARSVRARDAAREAELERERSANMALRRGARQLFAALVGVAALLVVAAGLGFWTWLSLEQAREASALAAQQSNIAFARALATQAELTLPQSAPAAALIAVEAMRATLDAHKPPVSEAETILRRVVEEVGGAPFPASPVNLTAMAISPDGSVLAAGDEAGVVRVWRLGKARYGAPDRVLAGHSGPISALELNHDGSRLATASSDGTVRVWNIADETAAVLILRGHADAVMAIDASASFDLLVSGGADNTARVWDLRSPNPARPAHVLRGHTDRIYSVVLSPDAKTLATVGADYSQRVWRLDDPNPEASARVLVSLGDYTNQVVFSPDGQRLFGGGLANAIYVWDLTHPDPDETLQEWPTGSGDTIALSKDGSTLVGGDSEGNVRVWDLTRPDPGTALRLLDGHDGRVETVAISADGRTVVTSGTDKTIRVWDRWRGSTAPARVMRGPEVTLDHLLLSEDGETLASASNGQQFGSARDPNARVWDLSDLQNGVAWEEIWAGSSRSSLSPDGALLVSVERGTISTADGEMVELNLLDTQTRERNEVRFQVAPDELGGIQREHSPQLSLDRRTLVLAWSSFLYLPDSPGTTRIKVLDPLAADPAATVRTLEGQDDIAFDLALEREGRLLASAGRDGLVRVWTLQEQANLRPAHVLDARAGRLQQLVLSPDGRTIIVAGAGPTLVIWSSDSGGAFTLRHRLEGDWASSVALEMSPDGTRLASGHADGAVRVWDLRSADPAASVLALAGREGGAGIITFSADGAILAAGSEDGLIRVWNLGVREPAQTERTLRGHEGAITALALGADGATLASGGADTTARVWNLRDQSPSSFAQILRGHGASVELLALGIAPGRLWSKSVQGELRVWNLNTRDLIATVCATTGRNLTTQEWGRLFGQAPYRKTCDEWPAAPGADAPPTTLPAPRPVPLATAAP